MFVTARTMMGKKLGISASLYLWEMIGGVEEEFDRIDTAVLMLSVTTSVSVDTVIQIRSSRGGGRLSRLFIGLRVQIIWLA